MSLLPWNSRRIPGPQRPAGERRRDRSRLRSESLERCEDRILLTTFNLTSATAIRVLDGPVVANLQQGTITSTTSGTTSSVNFSAADDPVIINGSPVAATSLVLNNPTRPAGLTSLAANLGSGTNTIDIAATSAAASTTVTTGAGRDTFHVALAGLGSTLTTLAPSPGGTNTLTIDATGVTAVNPSAPGVLTFTSASGAAESLAYSNFGQVTISGNFAARPGASRAIVGVEGRALVDTITATFAAPAPLSTAADFLATIDWGDGAVNPGQNLSAGTITRDASNPGVFDVAASHVYPEEGTYLVTTTISGPGTITKSIPTPAPPVTTILGSAGSFAILGGSAVTNTGLTTVSGDLGVSPGMAVTGFPPGSVTGGAIHAGDPAAVQAQAALAKAYAAIVGETATQDLSGQDLGGRTLTPGVYHLATSAQLTGQLTLDAQGDPNARFDFQIGTTLTTATGSSIRVINGGNPDNVYFQVGSSATLGTNTAFLGNILANTSITLTTGATLQSGRALAINGAVTLDTDAVATPAAPTAGGTVPVTIINTPGTPVATTATATIAQAPLLATASPLSAIQGKPTAANLVISTFTDTGGADVPTDYSATIDFGDGSPAVAGSILASASNFQVLAPSHTYARPGAFTVTVRVTEVNQANSQAIPETVVAVGQATVNPLVGVTSLQGATFTATEGVPSTGLVATFVDANPDATPADFLATTIDWGDGTTSLGSVTRLGNQVNGGFYVVTGAHTFAEEGRYPISVAVQSIDGTVELANGLAVVADAPLTAVGTPIAPIEGIAFSRAPVAYFTDLNPRAPLSDFVTSIDWGDGTPATLGSVTQPGGIGMPFLVTGSHTYADSAANGGFGAFLITTRIVHSGGSVATATSIASVADRPVVLGASLNPSSDSGLSNEDGITNVKQPNFFGNSEPSSTVRLTAIPLAGGAPIAIGSTTTDASGAWALTSTVPLADGRYAVVAQAIDRSGVTTGSTPVVIGHAGGPLVIDTVGPKVADLAFDRAGGRVTATFQDDRSGLDQSTVIDGKNYTFELTRALPGAAGRGQKLGALGYRITHLATVAGADPTASQVVVADINNHQAIRGGFYRLTIRSGGIEDVAGNALDGEFYGYLPSGNNKPGGDFVVDLVGVHNTTLAPLPDGSTASPLTPPGFRPTASTFVPTVNPSRSRPLSPLGQILDLPGQVFSTTTPAKAAQHKVAATHKAAVHKPVAVHHATTLRAHDAAVAHLASKKS